MENGELKAGWLLCLKATISVNRRVSDEMEAARAKRASLEVLGSAVEITGVTNKLPKLAGFGSLFPSHKC